METKTIQPEDDYFVFISYSSKDVKLAQWLQHELEDYHLPATLNGEPRQNLRKVFRDRSELSAGELGPQIESALKCSTHLVVVCSPNSAESEWVDLEIKTFIELHQIKFDGNDKNKIFPFIIEGNSPDEYFPETFKELRRRHIDLLGGDINKEDGGNDAAFIKVAAGLLNLPFDKLWNRYAREKAEKEQKEREQKEKLQISQSRFLAEKAEALIDEGDSYMARMLALEALPKDLEKPDRPYVAEAEAVLRKSFRKENAFLLGHNHSVISSIYSKDGNRIYSVSWDKRICVWNAMSGRRIAYKKRHLGNINSVSLSNDGSALVTASDDKKAIIWDSKTLKLRTKPLSHNAPVHHASFSPCGKYLLTALNDGNVCIWDFSGRLVKMFEADGNSIINAVLMDYANRIITVSYGRDNEKTWCNVKIWKWNKDSNDVECCKLLSPRWPNVQNENGSLSAEWHSDNIGLWFPSLAYCCKRNLLLFASERHIYIWQLTDFMLLKILSYSSTITTFAINENENLIALATSSNKVLFQEIPEDCMSWGKAKLFGVFEHGITDLSFCLGKRNLLLVSFDIGIIRQMDLGTNPYIKETSILADSISFISKRCFVVASSIDAYPGTIYDMNLTKIDTIIQENEFVEDLRDYGISYEDYDQIVFNKRDKIIFCIGDGYAYIYNLTNKKKRRQSIGCFSNYRCCFKAISEDGMRVVYAYKDGTMFLVDVITGKKIKLLERTYDHSLIHSACFSRDSKFIATTSNEGKVRVYNAKDGTSIQKMRPIQTLWGNSIEFSHRGDMIICASQDYYVYIWEFDKEKKRYSLKRPLSGHGERVCCASFSSDGKMAVSASPGKVIVWDVGSGNPLEIIELDTKGYDLNFVKFSPDNSSIFVSREGKLVIIDFPKLQNLIDVTKKRFRNRQLSGQEKKLYYLE